MRDDDDDRNETEDLFSMILFSIFVLFVLGLSTFLYFQVEAEGSPGWTGPVAVVITMALVLILT